MDWLEESKVRWTAYVESWLSNIGAYTREVLHPSIMSVPVTRKEKRWNQQIQQMVAVRKCLPCATVKSINPLTLTLVLQKTVRAYTSCSGLSQVQSQDMKIAALQFGPRLGDLRYNIDRADALLEASNLENVDILVGPELALTGKSFGGSLCFIFTNV